jgi:hypothetical protein
MLVGEAGTLAMIAYTGNTADTAAETAYLRFSMEIFPKLEEQGVRLAKRLIALNWSRDDLDTTVRRFRTDIEIFREANVPRFSQIEELSAGYQKITGGLSVDWDGTPKTIPQLQPYLKSADRAERERAFRLGAEAYMVKRDEFADLFDNMYMLRGQASFRLHPRRHRPVPRGRQADRHAGRGAPHGASPPVTRPRRAPPLGRHRRPQRRRAAQAVRRYRHVHRSREEHLSAR